MNNLVIRTFILGLLGGSGCALNGESAIATDQASYSCEAARTACLSDVSKTRFTEEDCRELYACEQPPLAWSNEELFDVCNHFSQYQHVDISSSALEIYKRNVVCGSGHHEPESCESAHVLAANIDVPEQSYVIFPANLLKYCTPDLVFAHICKTQDGFTSTLSGPPEGTAENPTMLHTFCVPKSSLALD